MSSYTCTPSRRSLGQKRRRAAEDLERRSRAATSSVSVSPSVSSPVHPSPSQCPPPSLLVESLPGLTSSPLTSSPSSPSSSCLSTPLPPSPSSTSSSGDSVVANLGERHNLGNMDIPCSHSGALHFMVERLSHSSNLSPKFGGCCSDGKVLLPPLRAPPQYLRSLYENDDLKSKEFRANIRRYNMALAFTSLGVTVDRSVIDGRGPYSFRILGELRHLIGSLLPVTDVDACFTQLYIYDASIAHRQRMANNRDLCEVTMLELQTCLVTHNVLCNTFRQAHEILREARSRGESDDIYAQLHYSTESDRRRYNLPTSDEISIVLPKAGARAGSTRDVIVRYRSGGLERINECHPTYLPLHYVLMFPFGELGWHINLRRGNAFGDFDDDTSRRVTQMQYFAFRIFPRRSEFSTILRSGKLFQQFLCDAWATTEQGRLQYVTYNQAQIRADVYSGLADAMGEQGDVNLRNIGRRVILPSSHIGSGRNMFEIFQDSMAITRFYGHPDIFGTMTANPRWSEIVNSLLSGQKVEDRPDLVSRVFELKRRALMEDIYKNNVLGRVVARVHTIEFQKRGLPHMHFLIFFDRHDKISTPADVDRIVSAEIVDANTDPLLFETIMSCQIHGPCGQARNPNSPCKVGGVCSKKYPKALQDHTSLDGGGYPIYRRRENGVSHVVGRNRIPVTNQDVVPFNPFLSRKYNCHINIEVCASIRAVKYIHKYIYKGHDRTTLSISGEGDEVRQYLDARYIGAPEASWRLLGMKMHEELPHVVRLALHLPGMHQVCYDVNDTAAAVLARGQLQRTTLTAFFKLCSEHESARVYTYQQFPQYFVWDKKSKVWTIRQQGFAIGRLYFAPPNSGERFYLRLLLTHIRGPTSFENLRTVEGVLCATFKDACIASGFLEDDSEWNQCLEEAAIMKSGRQLRCLFGVILLQCAPSRPELLWEKFRVDICDDLGHLMRVEYGIDCPSDGEIYDYGLYLLEKILNDAGKSLSDFPAMPLCERDWGVHGGNTFIAEHMGWNFEELQNIVEERVPLLNEEQVEVYDEILHSVENDEGKTFFLQGPAGTGKTFLYKLIASKVRNEGKIVLCVASSGIAAQLLPGGNTAHSTFKIPLDIQDGQLCPISKNFDLAELFKRVALIIWDEAPMQHRNCPEAVERTMRDLRSNDKLFGGITIVFGGDFCQILLVVIMGSREEIIGASLQQSYLWRHMKILLLRRNMRLEVELESDGTFAQELLKIGNGTSIIDPLEGTVVLPNHMRVGLSPRDLIQTIYQNLNSRELHDDEYFLDRLVLSCRNDDVGTLNREALAIFPGLQQEYVSADKVVVEDEVDNGNRYPTEYLNSLNPAGLPPSKLRVKVGVPIMLLRNISPKKGLCNGSRMVITNLTNRVIEARILSGDHKGDCVFLPRITLSPSSKEIPFKFQRRQFPVKLAFAMTVNKSQGQSVKQVGIDLRTPVFTHGQLYVALSRCTFVGGIKVLYPEESSVENTTINIVYPEVLIE